LVFAAFAASASAHDQPVRNVQTNWAQSRAQLNSEIDGINGEVSLTAAAINNSFSADIAFNVQLQNYQTTYRDSSAELNSDINAVVGDVSATAAAIGNSASATVVDSDYASLVNNQRATGVFRADLNIGVDDVVGNVSGTAAAIGNSLSVEAAGEGLNLSNNQFFRASRDLPA